MSGFDLRAFELLEAAHVLAQRWPVLPLHTPDRWACSCGVAQCGKRAGKHPRLNGWERSSTPGRHVAVQAWWSDIWPSANIGLACGVHLQALDVDGDDGRQSLAKLEDEHGPLPEGGPRVRTGSGGLQVYFACEPKALPTKVKFLPGLDWRGTASDREGQASLVVAPPSLHYSGRRYEWLPGAGPDRPLPAVPAWLAREVTPPPQPARATRTAPRPTAGAGYAEAALRGEYERVLNAQGGERNKTLNRAAFALGQLVGSGLLPRGRAEDNLLYAAMAAGLTKQEAVRTIRSGMRGGTRKPRNPR